MSNQSTEKNAATSTSSSAERRSTVPDILRHQHSFEKRYSHIIHKQILETSINKEVLKRQMDSFFGFSRNPTLEAGSGKDNSKETNDDNDKTSTEELSEVAKSSETAGEEVPVSIKQEEANAIIVVVEKAPEDDILLQAVSDQQDAANALCASSEKYLDEHVET